MSHVHASLLQRMSNDSSKDLGIDANDTITDLLRDTTVATFIMGAVGLPGNLLVIAVYFCDTTTSTRVYMFVLAVSDTVVCICGIGVTFFDIRYTTYGVIMYFSYMSIGFSLSLLTFVSIERLLAVRRPHKFNRSPLRAKKALVVLVVGAVLMASVLSWAHVKRYDRFLRLLPVLIALTCVTVMIVCYSLMALTLLINLRTANRTVGVANKTQGPSCSTVPDVTIVTATADVVTA